MHTSFILSKFAFQSTGVTLKQKDRDGPKSLA